MASFIHQNKLLVPILIVSLILGTILVFYTPALESPIQMEKTYTLFSLSFIAFVISFAIGVYLLTRWLVSHKKNEAAIWWGVSFIIFSILFLGLMLQASGVSWANTGEPHIFFLFRQTMILWVGGMLFGILAILGATTRFKILSVLLVDILSYVWFYYGLIVRANIELTMYGFLYFSFIPVCVIITYLFIKTAIKEKIHSLLTLGSAFALMAFSYMVWAPWHKNYFYYVCYSVFILSLFMMALGFKSLSYEKYLMNPEKARAVLNNKMNHSSAKKAS